MRTDHVVKTLILVLTFLVYFLEIHSLLIELKRVKLYHVAWLWSYKDPKASYTKKYEVTKPPSDSTLNVSSDCMVWELNCAEFCQVQRSVSFKSDRFIKSHRNAKSNQTINLVHHQLVIFFQFQIHVFLMLSDEETRPY
jgi:hypothetical protein